MKSKQKPMKHCESVYYQQTTVAKGRSQRHHDQGYHNSNSHFPISATAQSVVNVNIPPIEYHHEQHELLMFNSNMKSHPNVSKVSPYMHLHTMQSGVKPIGTEGSTYIQGQYSSQMQIHKNYPYKQQSIYDQMADSRHFGQEIDMNYHHFNYNNNTNTMIKTQGRNNIPITQRRIHNGDCILGQSVIDSLSDNSKSFLKGNQLRREIDGKLERVCEKVGMMTVEKKNCGDQNPFNVNNYNKGKRQLCYSTIVYQPTPSPILQSNQSNNPTDNSIIINHRTVQNEPPLIQVYQVKIIQLEKRVSFQHSKIQKLQQELLKQRQLLIKKEKEWLLRENQLLSWIEENQREIEQMRAAWGRGQTADVQMQQQNIIVIDDTQSNNFLVYDQPHAQRHHNNLSTHRNYHCSDNPHHTKPNSTSKYSQQYRRFSNNHSTISQAQSNNKTRQNNLLSTHKKSTYGKKNGSNRRVSVGDNERNKLRRCLQKEQNIDATNKIFECYCNNEVYHPLYHQTLKQPFILQNTSCSVLHQIDYDIYQLISLQAKSIQSLISHLNPSQKTIPSLFEQKQEQNLLFESYKQQCKQQQPFHVDNEIY